LGGGGLVLIGTCHFKTPKLSKSIPFIRNNGILGALLKTERKITDPINLQIIATIYFAVMKRKIATLQSD